MELRLRFEGDAGGGGGEATKIEQLQTSGKRGSTFSAFCDNVIINVLHVSDLSQSLPEAGYYLYEDGTCIIYQHDDV